MAVNISKRVGNVKNQRSHALNSTKTRQKLNLQVYRLADVQKLEYQQKKRELY